MIVLVPFNTLINPGAGDKVQIMAYQFNQDQAPYKENIPVKMLTLIAPPLEY